MDLTISIKDGKISSTLYEKLLALHLYIPPHSCHPPGMISGLIMGGVLRMYRLCSEPEDIEAKLRQFLHRILDRGYQLADVSPIFEKAVRNAKKVILQGPEFRKQLKQAKQNSDRRRVFLHLPYHCNDPTSQKIQKAWSRIVQSPSGKPELSHITQKDGALIPIHRLVVAYSRAPNIGNLLSYRKICNRKGPKVSSYWVRH